MDELLKIFGLWVVKGVSFAAIAFAFFQFLGKKWLDSRFAERLESFKHDQQKELETLRFKINSLFDRTTKLHQREFEVLPEAWGRLVDAFLQVQVFVSPLQTYSDLDRMKEAHLEEFIRECPLPEWQKQELRSEKEKTAYYRKKFFWHRLDKIENIARECSVYLRKNGIFLPPDISKKFSAIDDMIWGAIQEREINEKYPGASSKDSKATALRNDGERMLSELEKDVQGRLWNTDAGL